MRRVTVLRPEPGASATLDRLRKRGVEAISVPLFKVEPVEWRAPDPSAFDALLLTSANAARFGGRELGKLTKLPVYAVGEATAQAAREAGLTVAMIGDRGIDALLGQIEPRLRLLHLCGADRKAPEPGRQAITPVIVYRSDPVTAPNLAAAVGSVAMIHSPRAGRRFAELTTDRASIAVAAISAAAADACGSGWRSVDVAEQPSDDALLALAVALCNKPSPK